MLCAKEQLGPTTVLP